MASTLQRRSGSSKQVIPGRSIAFFLTPTREAPLTACGIRNTAAPEFAAQPGWMWVVPERTDYPGTGLAPGQAAAAAARTQRCLQRVRPAPEPHAAVRDTPLWFLPPPPDW